MLSLAYQVIHITSPSKDLVNPGPLIVRQVRDVSELTTAMFEIVSAIATPTHNPATKLKWRTHRYLAIAQPLGRGFPGRVTAHRNCVAVSPMVAFEQTGSNRGKGLSQRCENRV